jgi:hypothetical protein
MEVFPSEVVSMFFDYLDKNGKMMLAMASKQMFCILVHDDVFTEKTVGKMREVMKVGRCEQCNDMLKNWEKKLCDYCNGKKFCEASPCKKLLEKKDLTRIWGFIEYIYLCSDCAKVASVDTKCAKCGWKFDFTSDKAHEDMREIDWYCCNCQEKVEVEFV